MEPEHAPVDAHGAAADHAAGALPVFGPFDLNDPAFWAFVGLIIFIGLILYMKVPGTVTKSLDDRATKITAELAAAEALRRPQGRDGAGAGQPPAHRSEAHLTPRPSHARSNFHG